MRHHASKRVGGAIDLAAIGVILPLADICRWTALGEVVAPMRN